MFLFKDAVLTLWSVLLRAKWDLNVIKTMITLSLIRFESVPGEVAWNKNVTFLYRSRAAGLGRAWTTQLSWLRWSKNQSCYFLLMQSSAGGTSRVGEKNLIPCATGSPTVTLAPSSPTIRSSFNDRQDLTGVSLNTFLFITGYIDMPKPGNCILQGQDLEAWALTPFSLLEHASSKINISSPYASKPT